MSNKYQKIWNHELRAYEMVHVDDLRREVEEFIADSARRVKLAGGPITTVCPTADHGVYCVWPIIKE